MITPLLAFLITITWLPPTQFSNGEPMLKCSALTQEQIANAIECLDLVTIHWGNDFGDHPSSVDITNENATRYKFPDIFEPEETVCLVMTATTNEGDVSIRSNEICFKEIDPPASPFVFGAATQPDSERVNELLLTVGVTGKPMSFEWVGPPSGTTEVELIEYGKTLPVDRATFSSTTLWEFTPRRAGLFQLRMRNCNPDCGPWTNSADHGLLYLFKLAAPTGGGIQ